MKIQLRIISVCFALLALISFAVLVPGYALPPMSEAEIPSMAPHIAVYDLKLGSTRSGTNIAGADGRMVFEFNGSECEGYTVNMRFVLSIDNNSGKSTLTDVRTSSWEGGEGKEFRFSTRQYFDAKLTSLTDGRAARDEKDITVHLKKPKKSKLTLKRKALFPTAHTKLLIDAARKGQNVLDIPIYDGSEKGEVVYGTTAIIGTKHQTDGKRVPYIKNTERLQTMPSWPIALSFFNQKKSLKQDSLPDYEIGFRLYENGVSRDMIIDYGDFSLKGHLQKIDFLPENSCK